MRCNLSDQAGPGIKEEVTSPSWENREKFAVSREKCFLREDTPQKHDYIISSYEPLADLFFYTSISDQTITKQKQEAHGPRLAHLSGITTADMQMLCNIFSNPIIATNEKIIIWAVLSFEEEYMGLTVNGA